MFSELKVNLLNNKNKSSVIILIYLLKWMYFLKVRFFLLFYRKERDKDNGNGMFICYLFWSINIKFFNVYVHTCTYMPEDSKDTLFLFKVTKTFKVAKRFKSSLQEDIHDLYLFKSKLINLNYLKSIV